MQFTKVHGNGNDFVVIDDRETGRTTEELSRIARALCRRKFSIGADGVLVVGKAKGIFSGAEPQGAKADFAMRIFNADGSEGEMCGNGARALARYAFETKLAGEEMAFETPAGLIRARVEPPYAELDMGELDLTKGIFGSCVKSQGGEFPFVFLTVGVPHCVLLTEDYDALSAEAKRAIGRDLAHDTSLFPEGSNVSFAQVLSKDEVRAVTFERGVEDLTESCGTGCVAVAIACAVVRDTARSVRVVNPGGVNEVRLLFSGDSTSCHAWLKGRTALVAGGEIFEEAWL